MLKNENIFTWVYRKFSRFRIFYRIGTDLFFFVKVCHRFSKSCPKKVVTFSKAPKEKIKKTWRKIDKTLFEFKLLENTKANKLLDSGWEESDGNEHDENIINFDDGMEFS